MSDMTSIHDDETGSRPDAARASASAFPPALSEWERLARRKDELETVLGVGHIGYCRLRADGALEANSQFKAEWGWPPDEVLSWDAVESRVDVGDRGRLDHAVRQALAGEAPLNITVRVRPAERQGARWLALRGCLVRDGERAGSADLVITSQNVTTTELPNVRASTTSAAKVNGAEREKPQRQQTLQGLSFLVVDDELEARTVVAEMLQLEGASVTVTDSAPSALRQLQAQGAHFDIVVSDIGMPVEDGYSLVRKLRSSREGKDVMAIAVTGHTSPSDVAAAMDAGFDLHVPKPVDFETFVPLVRRLITRRHSG
jgi:CheY-like chemotaxis protein